MNMTPAELGAGDAVRAALLGEPEPAKHRRLRLTRASEIEPEPVEWAWSEGELGRIPAGALTIAAGREGTGKSSFGIWLATGITRGTLPGMFFGTRRSVLYVAVEDSWAHTLVPRLMAAGADLDLVYRVEAVEVEGTHGTVTLPRDIEELADVIAENGVALVVLDPLMSMIGAGIDTHKERDARRALDPLAKLADRTGAIILGIAHFNKGSGTDASSLITGSGAFKNVARAVFGFARDPDDGTRVMTQTKNSLGSQDLPSLAYTIEQAEIETRKGIANVGRLVFAGEADRSVSEILGQSLNSEERQEKMTAVEFLKARLEGGRKVLTREIEEEAAQAHGISQRTLHRARKALGVVPDQMPTGRNGKSEWWLSLPQAANGSGG
ncbi:AAA domain-containing protein [Nonomuraea polychroma]|uniref:AAA domain-containing protein n=1 Tax=Nonomuraea polychroma TaxID=46176 RepID=A0A438MIX8_9ACTN|nr:AAA family ATPase [Nonomuraea polychroma]RVX45764.1 AAA domain-containing protein [Nonomuraea polychroma]